MVRQPREIPEKWLRIMQPAGYDNVSQLARAAGISVPTACRVVLGGSKVPHGYTLQRIAGALGSPVEAVCELAELPVPTDGASLPVAHEPPASTVRPKKPVGGAAAPAAPQFLRIKGAAQVMSLSAATVLKMCQLGEIRTVRRDTRTSPYLIPVDAIKEWEEKNAYSPW